MRYSIEIKRGDVWERVIGRTIGAMSDEKAQEQVARQYPNEVVRAVPYERPT